MLGPGYMHFASLFGVKAVARESAVSLIIALRFLSPMSNKFEQKTLQGFRIRQAAKQIEVSKRFVEREIELGRLPVVRLGRRCVQRPSGRSGCLSEKVPVRRST